MNRTISSRSKWNEHIFSQWNVSLGICILFLSESFLLLFHLTKIKTWSRSHYNEVIRLFFFQVGLHSPINQRPIGLANCAVSESLNKNGMIFLNFVYTLWNVAHMWMSVIPKYVKIFNGFPPGSHWSVSSWGYHDPKFLISFIVMSSSNCSPYSKNNNQ